MDVCEYVKILYAHICVSLYVETYTSVRMCICMCIYVYIYIYTYASMCIYIELYKGYVLICVYVYVCMYMCIYIYICMYTYMYYCPCVYLCVPEFAVGLPLLKALGSTQKYVKTWPKTARKHPNRPLFDILLGSRWASEVQVSGDRGPVERGVPELPKGLT